MVSLNHCLTMRRESMMRCKRQNMFGSRKQQGWASQSLCFVISLGFACKGVTNSKVLKGVWAEVRVVKSRAGGGGGGRGGVGRGRVGGRGGGGGGRALEEGG